MSEISNIDLDSERKRLEISAWRQVIDNINFVGEGRGAPEVRINLLVSRLTLSEGLLSNLLQSEEGN